MNQLQFTELCNATALALRVEPPNGVDDARVLTIDDVEVVLTFDEENEPDTILCYVDLGEPGSHDRAVVCERLLQLNLQLGDTAGRYAFDIEGARAIFCVSLSNLESLDADFIAELLRYYVEMTDEPRAMVGNPGHHGTGDLEHVANDPFAGTLA